MLVEGAVPVEIASSIPEELKEKAAKRFSIGPSVERFLEKRTIKDGNKPRSLFIYRVSMQFIQLTIYLGPCP